MLEVWVWINYKYVFSSCNILINTVECIAVYSQVKTANNCDLTSPLTILIAVLLFSILYIYFHGILANILGHRFIVPLAFLYQTKHQGYHLCSRKPKATKQFSYTLTEKGSMYLSGKQPTYPSLQVTVHCAVKLLAINL